MLPSSSSEINTDRNHLEQNSFEEKLKRIGLRI
jgi:hypothetical protein